MVPFFVLFNIILFFLKLISILPKHQDLWEIFLFVAFKEVERNCHIIAISIEVVIIVFAIIAIVIIAAIEVTNTIVII